MGDEGEKDQRKFAKDFLEKWAKAEREERPVEESLKEVEAELERSATNPGLWFRKGVLLSQLEKWDPALESLRKAESLDPTLPRLQVALSFVLGRLGRPEEAAEANQRAIQAAAGAPAEEATVEQALKFLAEELREVAEAEVAETEAVKGLNEKVETLQAENQTLKAEIAALKAQ